MSAAHTGRVKPAELTGIECLEAAKELLEESWEKSDHQNTLPAKILLSEGIDKLSLAHDLALRLAEAVLLDHQQCVDECVHREFIELAAEFQRGANSKDESGGKP